MTVCVHLRNPGHGQASGGYDPVPERLFQNADEAGFFLEYDTDRSGDFSALRPLPTDNLAVLRLMSNKLRELEPRNLNQAAYRRGQPLLSISIRRSADLHQAERVPVSHPTPADNSLLHLCLCPCVRSAWKSQPPGYIRI
jgi:hypothetical protein